MNDYADVSASPDTRQIPIRKPAFDFGKVLSQTFSGLFPNSLSILIATSLISLLGSVIMLVSNAMIDSLPQTDSLLESAIGILASFNLILLGCVLYGFCMDMTDRQLRGQLIDYRLSAKLGMRHALPLLLIAAIFWAGFFTGYFLLIIPGLILSAGWAVAGPAYLFAGASIFGSFSESWRLTSGHKWMVWLVNFVVGLILQLIVVFLILLAFGLTAAVEAQGQAVNYEDSLGQLSEAIIFFAIAFSGNLMAVGYAAMKTAIYLECTELQRVCVRTENIL